MFSHKKGDSQHESNRSINGIGHSPAGAALPAGEDSLPGRYLSPAAGDGTGGSSGPSDRVGKMAGQIADEKAELEQMEEKYSQAVAEAVKVLSGLSDPLEREILTKRYISGMNWEQISRKMNYSASGIHRLKKSALQKLCSRMNMSEPK